MQGTVPSALSVDYIIKAALGKSGFSWIRKSKLHVLLI